MKFYILIGILCLLLHNEVFFLQENKQFEHLALEYLEKHISKKDTVINKLCIIYPDSININSTTYLYGVYLCSHDKNLLKTYEKEVSLELIPPEINRTILINPIETHCNNNPKARTIEVHGARSYKGRVYVEIKLLSSNKRFGESIIVIFDDRNKNIIDSCISTWQL